MLSTRFSKVNLRLLELDLLVEVFVLVTVNFGSFVVGTSAID